MRLVALVLLAGCLDEPALPTGHAHELRGDSLVVDLDGDAYDDVVLWGHAGDPRQEADLFVQYGSHAGLGPIDIVRLVVAPNDPWHEVLDVSLVVDASDRPAELIALFAEDSAVAPDGLATRVSYVAHIALANGVPSTPTYDGPFATPQLGGYAGDATAAKIAGYEGPSGPEVLVVGEHDAWHATSGQTPMPVTLAIGDDTIAGAFVLPRNTMSQQQEVMLVTNRHVFVLDGTTPVGAPAALSDQGLRMATAYQVGDSLIAASVPRLGAEVSLAKFSGPTQMLSVSTLETMHQPDAVGLFDVSNDGNPEVVTLEGGPMTLYGGVIQGAPAATPSFTAVSESLGYHVLVVGRFGDANPVYNYDATDPQSEPDCFDVDTSAETLTRCQ